jgi:hypothetical protein
MTLNSDCSPRQQFAEGERDEGIAS